jgi:acyl carrier protein
MGSDDLDSRVRSVIGEVSRRPVEGLGADEDLVERLGLDSLEGLHVLAALEKRLSVRFPDDRLGDLRTVRRIVDAVRAAGKGGDS